MSAEFGPDSAKLGLDSTHVSPDLASAPGRGPFAASVLHEQNRIFCRMGVSGCDSRRCCTFLCLSPASGRVAGDG